MHSQISLVNLNWYIFWVKSCGIKFYIHTVKLVWRNLSKMSLEKIATVNTTIEIKSKRKTWHIKRKKVWSIDSTFARMQELGFWCILFTELCLEEEEQYIHLRITHECFNELPKSHTTVLKNITTIRNAIPNKLTLNAKMFHNHWCVLLFFTFGDLKFWQDVFIKLIWWIRARSVFQNLIKQKCVKLIKYI